MHKRMLLYLKAKNKAEKNVVTVDNETQIKNRKKKLQPTTDPKTKGDTHLNIETGTLIREKTKL